MTPRTHEKPLSDKSSRAVLAIIRSNTAHSRLQISEQAGLSPSTVADRVDKLIAAQLLTEAGEGQSRGGRRPRTLRLNPDRGTVCAVDFGARHATVGLFDFAGDLISHTTHTIDIADGPDVVIPWVVEQAHQIRDAEAPNVPLVGLAAALPGPVDSHSGRLVSPSRMPGWNGVDARAELAAASGMPAIVNNDANLAALGESMSRNHTADPLVYVKVGSSIGCGIIVGGTLYHGYHGIAGDISHVNVPGAQQVLCSCGRKGCLDAVAGGRALTAALSEAGTEVTDSSTIVDLARDAHPMATQLLRQAGSRVGGVLAPIMNFFNPRSLVLGGFIGEADAFVAGAQSSIYTECLPMVTGELLIETSVAKRRAGILGGAAAMLDELINDPDWLAAT